MAKAIKTAQDPLAKARDPQGKSRQTSPKSQGPKSQTPPQNPQPSIEGVDPSLLEGIELKQQLDDALAKGDAKIYQNLKRQEFERGLRSQIIGDALGQDTRTWRTPDTAFGTVEGEMFQTLLGHAKVDYKKAQFFADNPALDELQKKHKDRIEQVKAMREIYRTNHEGPPPDSMRETDPQAWQDQWDKFEEAPPSLEIPFEEHQVDMDVLMNLDRELKAIDPHDSVFKNEKTKFMAVSLANMAEPGFPQLFSEGRDKSNEMSMVTKGSLAIAESGMGYAFETFFGLGKLADQIISKLVGTDPSPAFDRPMSAIVDTNGRVMSTGQKAYGADLAYLTFGRIFSHGTDKFAAEMRAGKAVNHYSSDESISVAVGSFIGGAAAFGIAAGPFMALGGGAGAAVGTKIAATLAQKGHAILKVGKIALDAEKIIPYLGHGIGSAAGLTSLEVLTKGGEQGVLKAFKTGAQLALELGLVGSLGALGSKGVAKALKQEKLPKYVSGTVKSAFEAMGFVIAGAVGDPLQSLWEALKDPTAENWKKWGHEFAVDFTGLMILRAVHGASPAEMSVLGMDEAATVAERRKAQERGLEGEQKLKSQMANATPEEREKILGSYEKKGVPRETMEKFAEGDKAAADEKRILESGVARSEEAEHRKATQERDQESERKDLIRHFAKRFREVEDVDALKKLQADWDEASKDLGIDVSLSDINKIDQFPSEGEERSQRIKAHEKEMDRMDADEEALADVNMQRTQATFYEDKGPNAEEEPNPTRMSDIIFSLEGFEGDPIQVRQKVSGFREKVKGGRVLGYFYPREKLIRRGAFGYITTAIHEFSHALSEHVYGFSTALKERFLPGSPPELYEQLIDLGRFTSPATGYTREQLIDEGMAEFWNRFMSGQEQQLAEQTPELFAYMMKSIAAKSNEAVSAQIMRNKALIQRYRNMTEGQRAIAQIHFEDDAMSKEAKRARGPLRRLFYRAFDKAFLRDAGGLAHAMTDVMKLAGIDPKDIPMGDNPLRLLEMLKGAAADRAETFLWDKAVDFYGNEVGGSLKNVLSMIPVKDRGRFFAYVLKRFELEQIDLGKGTMFPRDETARAAKYLETPVFVEAAKKLKEYTDALVLYMVDSGAMGVEQALKIVERYMTYLPQQRILRDSVPKQGPRRGVAERGTGVHGLRGRGGEIKDPMKVIMEMTSSMIAKTHQALTMNAMVKMGTIYPGMGRLISKVPRGNIPENHPVARIIQALYKEMYLRKGYKDDNVELEEALETLTQAAEEGELESLTLFSQPSTPTGSRAIIAHTPWFSDAELSRNPQLLKHNGKIAFWEADTEAYKTLMGMDNLNPLSRALGPWGKIVTAPAQVVRFGATVLSPAFTLKNAFRDPLLYPLTSQSSSKFKFIPIVGGFVEMVLGAVEMASGSEQAKMLRRLAGRESSFYGDASSYHARTPVDMFDTSVAEHLRFDLKHPIHAVKQIADFLIKGLSMPERFLRVREAAVIYRDAIKEGDGPEEATLRSLEAFKESTINYSRAGAIARAINEVVPYTTASIAAKRKILSALSGKDGGKAAAQAWIMGTASLTAMSLLTEFLYGDEKWYQDTPVWMRLRYWTFRNPFTDKPFHLPKPFEAGQLFTNPIEALIAQSRKTNPVKTKAILWDLIGGMFFEMGGLPSFMGPAFEVSVNKSLHFGRPIIPEWMERKKPENQFTTYNTWMSRTLGKEFGLSPAKIEYFISAQTGGLGLKVMRATDQIRSWAGMSAPAVSQDRLAQMPFIGTLMGAPHKQSRAVNEFYELSHELDGLKDADELTPSQRGLRSRVNRIRRRLTRFNNRYRAGRMSQDELNLEKFNATESIVKESQEIMK